MNELIFTQFPAVTIATNTFINCPVPLKFDDINLIELVQEEQVGFTTQIPIYHSDGTYLAKVKGNRIFLTEDGKKVGLTMEKKANVWECQLEKRTLFEIHQQSGNLFKTQAELHTPTGHFVKCTDSPKPGLIDMNGKALQVGGITMSGNIFSGKKTGIWIRSNGQFSIG
jgi:hypothetical protein